MKILFAMVILAAWVLGIYDGDCTAAVMFSLFGGCALIQGSRKCANKVHILGRGEAVRKAQMRCKHRIKPKGRALTRTSSGR